MPTKRPEPIRQSRLEVRLPPLHAKQQQVLVHPAKYKVVVCGRQWGKTTLGAVMCVADAVKGEDARQDQVVVARLPAPSLAGRLA